MTPARRQISTYDHRIDKNVGFTKNLKVCASAIDVLGPAGAFEQKPTAREILASRRRRHGSCLSATLKQ